jgi:hypothetical protein
MKAALRPKADEEKHPHAFYKGWRLMAIDGTPFSVSNTPQILASLSKAASRSMKAAFAKLGALILCGWHLLNTVHGNHDIADLECAVTGIELADENAAAHVADGVLFDGVNVVGAPHRRRQDDRNPAWRRSQIAAYKSTAAALTAGSAGTSGWCGRRWLRS